MSTATLHVVIMLLCVQMCVAADLPRIDFAREPGQVAVTLGSEPVATYMYADEDIPRPYFCQVSAPGGVQVTRSHPPREEDLDDHATMHPGIWMSFGDISGNDYWRLRARTVHDGFVQEPEGGAGRGTFAVRNRYLSEAGDRTICTEVCRFTFLVRPEGYLILWDSTFSSGSGDFDFGDQEEMGLGVRLPTRVAEKTGHGGLVTDSEGREGARTVWGKQADWCDYSGEVNGQWAGITIMPHPENFRRCWWHSRDYGFMAANPFGRNAFTKGEKSRVLVKEGESLRLRHAVLLHAASHRRKPDLASAYADFLRLHQE